MKDAPAFDLYAQRWLAGTSGMTAAERGAYITLLCEQWEEGGLPDNQKRLMTKARCRPSELAFVLEKFPVCPDGMRRNARLEIIRAEQRERILISQFKSQRGVWKRRNGDAPYPHHLVTEDAFREWVARLGDAEWTTQDQPGLNSGSEISDAATVINGYLDTTHLPPPTSLEEGEIDEGMNPDIWDPAGCPCTVEEAIAYGQNIPATEGLRWSERASRWWWAKRKSAGWRKIRGTLITRNTWQADMYSSSDWAHRQADPPKEMRRKNNFSTPEDRPAEVDKLRRDLAKSHARQAARDAELKSGVKVSPEEIRAASRRLRTEIAPDDALLLTADSTVNGHQNA